jgi:hypothetical protein
VVMNLTKYNGIINRGTPITAQPVIIRRHKKTQTTRLYGLFVLVSTFLGICNISWTRLLLTSSPPPKDITVTWDHVQMDLPSAETEQTKPKPEQCRQECPPHLKHKNIILLDHYEAAGLGNRHSLFSQMANLAGYLCATVYAPPPHTMVSNKNTARDRILLKKILSICHLLYSAYFNTQWWRAAFRSFEVDRLFRVAISGRQLKCHC